MNDHGDLGLAARRLDEDAVDAFLREHGFGVLSLAADGEAYGLPISFGYDGDRLVFVFQRPAPESRKTRFAEQTERASFLVYEVTSKTRWWSVVVGGPLRRVPAGEWDALVDALEESAWYPDVFSATQPVEDFVGYELRIEEATGLAGSGTE